MKTLELEFVSVKKLEGIEYKLVDLNAVVSLKKFNPKFSKVVRNCRTRVNFSKSPMMKFTFEDDESLDHYYLEFKFVAKRKFLLFWDKSLGVSRHHVQELREYLHEGSITLIETAAQRHKKTYSPAVGEVILSFHEGCPPESI